MGTFFISGSYIYCRVPGGDKNIRNEVSKRVISGRFILFDLLANDRINRQGTNYFTVEINPATSNSLHEESSLLGRDSMLPTLSVFTRVSYERITSIFRLSIFNAMTKATRYVQGHSISGCPRRHSPEYNVVVKHYPEALKTQTFCQ
jgi:hypothetical protein